MNRSVLVALLAGSVAGAACGQEVQDRPAGTYQGSFRPPPGGGGGGGGDGGVGDGGVDDGGTVATRTVQGRVVAIDDLGAAPDRAAGVPNRRVAGYGPDGALVAVVSGAEGAFALPGVAPGNPIVLSASGDPPSFVVLPLARFDAAVVPVISTAMLDDLAASVGSAPGAVAGHVLLWLEDSRGEPVRGLAVEVLSASPVEGPFYGTTDPIQLVASVPTGAEGLVVFLNAVAGELELSVFRVETPETTETIRVPVEAGIVTFTEVTTGL